MATAPAGFRSGRDHDGRKAAKVARTARLLGERVALAGPNGAGRTPLEICGAHTLSRTLLACLKLHRDRLTQPIASLIAGERSKVALTQLLLLDEPSNHLEIEAQEAVERMLAQFPGTVLLVSHDRRFLESVTSRKVGLSNGL